MGRTTPGRGSAAGTRRLAMAGAVGLLTRLTGWRTSRVLREDRPHSGGDGGRVYSVGRVDLEKRSKSSGREMVLVPQLFSRAFSVEVAPGPSADPGSVAGLDDLTRADAPDLDQLSWESA